jgi:hypothetical protein
MLAPVRNAYAQRVAGSRVAVGARNVAKMTDAPFIETAAESKRTGAQEESLLHEGGEKMDAAVAADAPENASAPATQPRQLTGLIKHSLAWNERLRAATDAYRFTIEKLDKSHHQVKPGDVYDAPF